MNAGVKPGYKHTEVGVIPEDWVIKRISDIGQIKTGPFGTLLKAHEYVKNDGVPLISVGEIGEGKFRITDRTPLIPPAIVKRLPQYVLKDGDIVFGRKGAVDRSVLVTVKENGWFLGSDGISLRPQRGHPPFIAWQFRTEQVRSWLQQNSVGTTMASLNQAVLNNVCIAIAPFHEQKAIASVLSDIDTLIISLDQLIAKKRDMQKAAMQQLLSGQQRLPGFSGEWEVKQLGDVLRVRHGKNQSKIEVSGGKYPILATGGEIGRTNTFLYDKPSVLIGRKGTIDRPIYRNEPFWTVDTLFYTEITKEAVPVFIYYKFLMIDWRSYNEASGVPSLNASTIEAVDIVIPDIAEQIAIAAILSDMDSELTALETRRDKACQFKQGMMQELLTGRIRLL